MKIVALLALAGCSDDLQLGPADWTEMPVGESELFKQAFATRTGEIAVRFYDADEAVTCSQIKVQAEPEPSESRLSFSAPAIRVPGMVPVGIVLEPSRSSATILMSSRTYAAGTITLTSTEHRLVGTFAATGVLDDGTAARITGTFDAPLCD